VDDATLRRVEQQLNDLTAEGGKLHRNSALATYVPGQLLTPDRVRFQRILLDELKAEGEWDIEKDGLAALVTAGPPGAGKSTLVTEMRLADGWRRIDADDIKVRLLQDGLQRGVFDSVLNHGLLADDYPVMLNELASLVHNESVFLADQLIERCLEARENVVIEGTLSWEGLPRRYARMLELNEYARVTILDVEVDCATALEHAYNRWMEGRIREINGAGKGGGRFTPREAITQLYDATGRFSACNVNAVDFFTSDGVSGFGEIELIVSTGPLPEDRHAYKRIVGKYTDEAPRYLKDSASQVPVPEA
jgi:predicted kinase